jgi:hypothetical protein
MSAISQLKPVSIQSHIKKLSESSNLKFNLENISDTTVNRIKQADIEIDQITNNFDANKQHIASIIEKSFSAIKKIFPKEEEMPLRNPSDTSRALKRQGIKKIAKDYLRSIVCEWNKKWASLRSRYNKLNDAKYPIVDLNGNPIKVATLSSLSTCGSYRGKDVQPFLSKRRAELYDELLSVEPFTEEDVEKNPLEAGLKGQNKVVAKKDIKRNTCIGIYTGTFIPKEFKHYVVNDTYLFQLPDESGEIDGAGILSRMNTSFQYDKHGKPSRQAPGGKKYNVKSVAFQVTLQNGLNSNLLTFFSTRDIKRGEELRWRYGYTAKEVRSMN